MGGDGIAKRGYGSVFSGDSSSSSSSRLIMCGCGMRAVLRKSGTPKNPGRMFLGCPNFSRSAEKCDFFQWVDEPTCADCIKKDTLVMLLVGLAITQSVAIGLALYMK